MKQYSTPILEDDVMILDDVILLSGTSGSHDMIILILMIIFR